MTGSFRKRDYIISFVVVFSLFLFNFVGGGTSILPGIMVTAVIALIISLILGTITNLLFRRKGS